MRMCVECLKTIDKPWGEVMLDNLVRFSANLERQHRKRLTSGENYMIKRMLDNRNAGNTFREHM